MALSLQEELTQLCAGVLSGGAFGLSMDIYRVIRRWLPGPLRAVTDVCCSLLWGAWLFALGMELGSGTRLFLLASAGLGWAVYLWGLSDPVGSLLRPTGVRKRSHRRKDHKML